MLYSAAIDSPIGRLVIAAAEDAVVAIAWADTAEGEENPLLVEARHQLEAYFDRRLQLLRSAVEARRLCARASGMGGDAADPPRADAMLWRIGDGGRFGAASGRPRLRA